MRFSTVKGLKCVYVFAAISSSQFWSNSLTSHTKFTQKSMFFKLSFILKFNNVLCILNV